MRPPACSAISRSPRFREKCGGSGFSPSGRCATLRITPIARAADAAEGPVARSPRDRVVHRPRRRGAKDEVALLRWLGRSTRSAVAVVRRGRITLTNALFRELEAREGEWRWSSGPHAQLRYPSLRQLVAGEARDVLR